MKTIKVNWTFTISNYEELEIEDDDLLDEDGLPIWFDHDFIKDHIQNCLDDKNYELSTIIIPTLD